LKSAAIFACACATSSGLPNPLRTMSEPAAASARAMPSPIPLVEPVTSESLPASVGPAATFCGLMATFMAQPPPWDDDFGLILRGNLPDRSNATPMPIG